MTALLLAVLICVLMGFAAYALGVGLLGVLPGERFEQCPRCHHHGLTAGGRLHRDGCPLSAEERLLHSWPHDLHLRHH